MCSFVLLVFLSSHFFFFPFYTYTHTVHRPFLPGCFNQLIFFADLHLKFQLSNASRWRLVSNKDIQVETVQKEKGQATAGPTLYSAGKSKLHMLIWPSEIEVHAIRFAQSCPWTSPPYFFSFTFESKCSMQQYIQNVDSARVIDSIHMNGSNSRWEWDTSNKSHHNKMDTGSIDRISRPCGQCSFIAFRMSLVHT